MSVINSEINQLIFESDSILSKDVLTKREMCQFKIKSDAILNELEDSKYPVTINDIAARAIKFRVRRIRNPICRWLYYLITTARDDITYNAPYLRKHSDSDYNKTYVFWTVESLKGLNHTLEILETE